MIDDLIRSTDSQTMSLTTAAPSDTLDFEFTPGYGGSGKPYAGNGNICVNILTTTVSGDTNKLTMTATPIQNDSGTDIVPENGIITLVPALDWTTAKYYTFPITDAIGPCKGIRVTGDITGVGAGTEANIRVWLTYA